jgi:hypothetical protein
MTMSNSTRWTSLGLVLVGALLFCIILIQLYLENGFRASQSTMDQLLATAALLVGVLIAALLTARSAKRSGISNRLPPFNETEAREIIRRTLPMPEFVPPSVDYWGISSRELVGKDNSLALANLRLELERSVRQVAANQDINIKDIPIGTQSVIKALKDQIIPNDTVKVIGQIEAICNASIHGRYVPSKIAISVVRQGEEIILRLPELVHKQRTKS